MDLMDDGPISLLGLRPQTFSQQIIFFCFFYSVINCVDMSCISSVFDFTGHRAFFWFLSALLLFSILLFKWCNSWCTQRGCVVPLVAKPAETFQNLPPSLLLLNIVPQCVWVRRHGRSFKTLKKKKKIHGLYAKYDLDAILDWQVLRPTEESLVCSADSTLTCKSRLCNRNQCYRFRTVGKSKPLPLKMLAPALGEGFTVGTNLQMSVVHAGILESLWSNIFLPLFS